MTYFLHKKENKLSLYIIGIDYGQPWRKTFGDNLAYTDWHEDNFFHAVKQEVCVWLVNFIFSVYKSKN